MSGYYGLIRSTSTDRWSDIYSPLPDRDTSDNFHDFIGRDHIGATCFLTFLTMDSTTTMGAAHYILTEERMHNLLGRAKNHKHLEKPIIYHTTTH